MDSRSFFRGTSAEQDDRFANKEKKLLKSMKFPPIFSQKVDITKVHLPSFKKWMNNQTNLLGIDDDLLVDYVYELLEAGNPDPKVIQINITGFLEGNTSQFMTDLWTLLVEAQNCEGGIPNEFLSDIAKSSLQNQKEEDRIKEALNRTKINIENANSQTSYGLQHSTIKKENIEGNVQKIKGVSRWDDKGSGNSIDNNKIKNNQEQSTTIDEYHGNSNVGHRESPDRNTSKRDRDYYDRRERDYYDSRRYDDYDRRDRDYRDRDYRDKDYRDNRYYSSSSRNSYDSRRDRDYYDSRRYDDYDRRDSYHSSESSRRYDDHYESRRYDDYESRRDYDRKDRDSYSSDKKYDDKDYDNKNYSSSNTNSKTKYSDDEEYNDYKTTDTRSVKKRKDEDENKL